MTRIRKTGKLDLRIEPALANAVRKKARQENRTLSAVVRDLLDIWLHADDAGPAHTKDLNRERMITSNGKGVPKQKSAHRSPDPHAPADQNKPPR